MEGWSVMLLMVVVLVGDWLALKAIDIHKYRYFKSIRERMRLVEHAYTAELDKLREARRLREEILQQYVFMERSEDD